MSNVIDPKKEHAAAAAAKNMTSNKAPTPSLNRAVRLTGIWTTITKVAELQLLLTSDSLYKNHEADAWAQRQAQLNEDPDAMADEDCNDEGEEGAEGAEGASVPYAVDPKYL